MICVLRAHEAFHIRKDGSRPYASSFRFVHVFHKGFAVVLDKDGWCHIDPTGQPIYAHRFKYLEPFYNGIALAIDVNDRHVLVDEAGGITLVGP